MAKITFLGTAASIPSKKRDNTAFVFSHKNETWLIDCPGSPAHKLLRAGFDFKKIKKIIITHHHPDHIYGIVSFIHTHGFISKKTITIFSNATCIKMIKQLMRLFGLQRNQFPKVSFINVFKTKKECFYRKPDLVLKALPNKHTFGSFGVKFMFGAKALFYSSDTAFSPDLLRAAEPFGYLVHDCTASSAYFRKHPSLNSLHTHAQQLKAYLLKHPHLKLIPIHFLTVEKNEEQRIKRELKTAKKQVVWVSDFAKLTL